MPWNFINSATGTGASPTVDITGLPGLGDLLIFVHNGGGSSAITSVPSGFTQQFDYAGASPYLRISTKISNGTETTLSENGGSANGNAAVLIYRYIKGETPDVTATVSTTGTTNSITTTAANELVVSVWNNNAATVLTADAATTQRVGFAGGGPGTSYMVIGDENKATAGATTGRTATGATAAVSTALAFKNQGGGLFSVL